MSRTHCRIYWLNESSFGWRVKLFSLENFNLINFALWNARVNDVRSFIIEPPSYGGSYKIIVIIFLRNENTFLLKFGKKRPKMTPNVGFVECFEIFVVIPGNNLKRKLILLISHHQSHIWRNSNSELWCRSIKLQDSLKCNISRKKWMMKFIFGMQINMKVFYKLIISFWVCLARLVQSIQNKKFAYLCNISKTMWWMKLNFCLQMNIKVLYKVTVWLWMCVARHA